MFHLRCRVLKVTSAAPGTFILSFHSPELSRTVRAGQFVNIRVHDGIDPLLRRPFSIHRTEGDTAEVLFQRIGKGTALLAQSEPGSDIDLLGPLGNGFNLEDPSFETAVLVGGGLGVAPFPIATAALRRAEKKIITLIGARTSALIIDANLTDVRVATDDGTRGFHGTVVDLAWQMFSAEKIERPRLFGCGPSPMLRALAALALTWDIRCEVSLEGQMACGIGICQGCPVEVVSREQKYALMCKDGPVFNTREIRI